MSPRFSSTTRPDSRPQRISPSAAPADDEKASEPPIQSRKADTRHATNSVIWRLRAAALEAYHRAPAPERTRIAPRKGRVSARSVSNSRWSPPIALAGKSMVPADFSATKRRNEHVPSPYWTSHRADRRRAGGAGNRSGAGLSQP